jgi:hypothetical protein
VPLVFVLVTIWLIVNTWQTKRVESAVGLGLILIGLPLYFYFKQRKSQQG